jgi:hypothetical protein
MPTTIAGFKGHLLYAPLHFPTALKFSHLFHSYALARHIRQTEVIHPLVEIGKFRGEAVYPRGNVLSLKTSESWMRQGYKIKEGAQPMKMIKQRAVTINKRRAVEMALAEQSGDNGEGNEGGLMQGLYAKNQTELYIPPPVVDVSFSFLQPVILFCTGRRSPRFYRTTNRIFRVSFPRMTLEILIFMFLRWYRKGLCIFLVRFALLKPDRRHLIHLLINTCV